MLLLEGERPVQGLYQEREVVVEKKDFFCRRILPLFILSCGLGCIASFSFFYKNRCIAYLATSLCIPSAILSLFLTKADKSYLCELNDRAIVFLLKVRGDLH